MMCVAGVLPGRAVGSFLENITLPLYFNKYAQQFAMRSPNLAEIMPFIYAKGVPDLVEIKRVFQFFFIPPLAIPTDIHLARPPPANPRVAPTHARSHHNF